jgi:voltage-gated potassium channel Kch
VALQQSSEALRRPQRILWISFPLIALLSLVLGYIGLDDFLTGNKSLGHRPIDLIYYDLQLFVMGSDPLQQAISLPLTLNIARFSAPAVTVYAVVEAVRLLLAVEFSRIRARHASGHAIVCGDSAFADALTRRLRAQAVEVVEIRTEPDEFVTPGEPLRVIGDARDPDVLISAGVEHAATVYACAERSATNIATALAVTRAVKEIGGPLLVHSLVDDPDFCAIVQASFLTEPTHRRVHLDFFSIDHIAARRLFVDAPMALSGTPPRILIAGTDGFARAIAVEAARAWRIAAHNDGDRLLITMVGEDAEAAIACLSRRYPFLAGVCKLVAIDQDLLSLMRHGRLTDPPDRLLITYQDEEFALRTAMTAEHYWRGHSGSITLRLDGALIGGPNASGQLDAFGALRVFGAMAAAGDPDLIRDDLIDRLARVLHDRYLLGRQSRGDLASGRPDAAMVSWDELPERFRLANRSAAEDISRKLAVIGCVIAPRHPDHGQEVALSEADVDRLARMEHERWCHEHDRAGWRYAPLRDEARKLHPGLLSWEKLPEPMKMRNYDPVRELPSILGEAGFQIVRA